MNGSKRILLRRELDGWSVSDEFHISFDGLLNELKKVGFEIIKEPQGKYHKVFLVAPREEESVYKKIYGTIESKLAKMASMLHNWRSNKSRTS